MINGLRLKWILSPSLLSGPLTVLVAGFIWISAGWAYVTDSQLFYDQLFGPYGAVTLLQLQAFGGGAQNAIANGPLTYYVLLVTVSVIAGLSIYVVLESISRVISGVSLFWRQVHTNRNEARQAAKESLLRLGLRSASLVAWALYWVVFLNVLVPFSIIVLQQTLDSLNNGQWLSWLLLIGTFLGLIASIHLHVTFARLVFLRIRIFGGYDAQLADLENR